MFVTANHVLLLMEIGGFKTHGEFEKWLYSPLAGEEEGDQFDWLELALREMGCFDEDCGDDNDPHVLRHMRWRAKWFMQEQVNRLLARHGHSNPLKRGWRKRHPPGQMAFPGWVEIKYEPDFI